MTGMARDTGLGLSFEQHLAQSIADILSTPIGSRVMRRSYGSELPRLIDAPLNGETQVDVFAAVADALARWEPRLRLVRVSVDAASAGLLRLSMVGETINGETTVSAEVRGAA